MFHCTVVVIGFDIQISLLHIRVKDLSKEPSFLSSVPDPTYEALARALIVLHHHLWLLKSESLTVQAEAQPIVVLRPSQTHPHRAYLRNLIRIRDRLGVRLPVSRSHTLPVSTHLWS